MGIVGERRAVKSGVLMINKYSNLIVLALVTVCLIFFLSYLALKTNF